MMVSASARSGRTRGNAGSGHALLAANFATRCFCRGPWHRGPLLRVCSWIRLGVRPGQMPGASRVAPAKDLLRYLTGIPGSVAALRARVVPLGVVPHAGTAASHPCLLKAATIPFFASVAPSDGKETTSCRP